MRNQQSAYAKTKTQISFAVTAKLISAIVFATWIVHFLFFLNPKFQASSVFLLLHRPVCVGPVRKPHCWFSHEAAHKLSLLITKWLPTPRPFAANVCLHSGQNQNPCKVTQTKILKSSYSLLIFTGNCQPLDGR